VFLKYKLKYIAGVACCLTRYGFIAGKLLIHE